MQRIISCIPRDKFAQALSKGPGELYLSIVASKLALVVGALGNEPVRDDARCISALPRHRRRHVHCAGMGVSVLKMTTSEGDAEMPIINML